MKNITKCLVVFLCSISTMACSEETAQISKSKDYVPAARSYADAEMWQINKNDTGDGCDVFYIPSTWEFDWYTADSGCLIMLMCIIHNTWLI